MSKDHSQRKHSKYSASGSEMWFNCSGSVALNETLPEKSNKWSLEGTQAHEELERILKAMASYRAIGATNVSHEMFNHGINAAQFIFGLHAKTKLSELLFETRVILDFINPEMFGTFDGAVIDHFGTLHIFDYKYGVSLVSPKENLQMIFYALGIAYRHNWNFKNVRLWIIQPRVRGYHGPAFWEMTIHELKAYVPRFAEAVKRVEKFPNKLAEGSWCHWCKANQQGKCPLKQEAKNDKAKAAFSFAPIT